MTYYDVLIEKYGIRKIDSLLATLAMQDTLRYNVFLQYIKLTEYNITDISGYKLHTNTVIDGLHLESNEALLEFMNIFNQFDSRLKKYNTVITYGTYDLFHYGHLQLLKRIKALCNNLIVAISTDEFNKLKGKTCVIPYDQRAEIVSNIKFVNKVIPENNWEQKIDDIKKYKVNAFIMGNDWEGKFDYLKEYCDVIYLPRTDGISTTQLKTKLKV